MAGDVIEDVQSVRVQTDILHNDLEMVATRWGEASEVPRRSPSRGPPYWKSRVLRLKVLGEEDEGGGRGSGADEAA